MQRPPSPYYEGNSPHSVDIIVVTAVFWFLAAVSVVFRFISRLNNSLLLADDWAILFGVILSFGLVLTCNIWAAIGDAGWAQTELSPSQAEIWLKFAFAAIILYASAILAIKLSLLLLYKRIFEVSQKFMLAIFAVALLVVFWFIGFTLATIFQCSPIVGAWKPAEAHHCIKFRSFVLGPGITTILTDVIILCMPMPLIWRLEISLSRKLAVTVILLLGAFACIVSILRVISLSNITEGRGLDNPALSVMYQCLEPCVGIICACLPTITRLIRLTRKQQQNTSSTSQSHSHLDTNSQNYPVSSTTKESADLESDDPTGHQLSPSQQSHHHSIFDLDTTTPPDRPLWEMLRTPVTQIRQAAERTRPVMWKDKALPGIGQAQ